MLAQELFRKDTEIVDLLYNRTYTSDQIENYTQHLKHAIYNKLNGNTLNKIVYIDTNDFFIVLCSMRAVWELGASIFLNDVDPKVKELSYFKKFYEVIDLVIGPLLVSKWTVPDKHISTDNYVEQCNEISQPFEYIVSGITPETVAYYTTSSGTTGDPKLLPFTHYQTVTISKEIHQYLDIKESDQPYHFKTLHHSSLFNSFALPMLSTCKTHYCGLFTGDSSEFLTKIINVAISKQANFFLLPYNWIRDFNAIESTDLAGLTTFITIQGNTEDEMADLFARFNPKQVINYFGSSEIGTMFISRTTQENINEYNPNRFHDVTSYIDYKILPTTVECKWKYLNNWYVLPDKMKEENGSIWHYGRETEVTFGDQTILLQNLINLIEEFLGSKQFIVVPDYIQQKMYLAVFQEDLSAEDLEKLNITIQQNFHKAFNISSVHRFDRTELLYGMKISGPLLLYLFREKERETQI